MRISDVFKEDIGLGGVVSLLWFKRRESFALLFSLQSSFQAYLGRPPTLGYEIYRDGVDAYC